MDASTIASLAALVIAVFALCVAFAQVLQQYYGTGQLIRLCDSVVYGGLPGQGHRQWKMSQFRFRVVYQVPQLVLEPYMWPPNAAPSFTSTRAHFVSPELNGDIESEGEESLDSTAAHGGQDYHNLSPFCEAPLLTLACPCQVNGNLSAKPHGHPSRASCTTRVIAPCTTPSSPATRTDAPRTYQRCRCRCHSEISL